MINKIIFRTIVLKNSYNSLNLRKLNIQHVAPKFLRSYSSATVQAAFKPFNIKKKLNDIPKQYSENNFAHSIMHSLSRYNDTIIKSAFIPPNDSCMTESEFTDLLDRNWKIETASNIVDAFIKACKYCKDINITLSDTRFDKLVDGLMKKCRNLTDTELFNLLQCIKEYPQPALVTSHNFHDIWSCLDDMCIARHSKWNRETLIKFADIWYLLGLVRYSEYIKECIKRLSRKVNHLTPEQLVYSFFLINVCRKPYDMFVFECQLEKHVSKLTIEELGIISMGFFKSQTPIKGTLIISQILEKLLDTTDSVHEIALSAILKVIRYSPHLPLVDVVQRVQAKLLPEIDRFSLLACLHIALLGTTTQFLNTEVMTKISEKLLANISNARLKDLERFAFALSLYNLNPPTSKPIYPAILNELYKVEREEEIEKFPKCFSCCIHYLGLQAIYPYDLINKVLSKDFIKVTYGENQYKVGREILFIDLSIPIDCPNYKGNRISEKLRKRLSSWTINWLPEKDATKRISAGDKLLFSIADTLETVLGGKEYLDIIHVCPHFIRPDILFCKDKEGNPAKVGKVEKEKIEDILYPIDDNQWFTIIAASWNSYIRGTLLPTGILATKIRQLKKIGYTPIMVPWHEFTHLSSQQKIEYINNKIR